MHDDHMIIFNDRISKFYQYSIWGFCMVHLCFSVSALAKKKKKYAGATKFLGTLKQYVS